MVIQNMAILELTQIDNMTGRILHQFQGQDQGQGQDQKWRQRSALQQQMVLALTLVLVLTLDLAQITKPPSANTPFVFSR